MAGLRNCPPAWLSAIKVCVSLFFVQRYSVCFVALGGHVLEMVVMHGSVVYEQEMIMACFSVADLRKLRTTYFLAA